MKKTLCIITVVTALTPLFCRSAASSAPIDDKSNLVTVHQGAEQWPYQLAFHEPIKPESSQELFCCIVADPDLNQFPADFAQKILLSPRMAGYEPHADRYRNARFVTALREVSEAEIPEALLIKDRSLPLLTALIIMKRQGGTRFTYHGPSGAAISNNVNGHFEPVENPDLILLKLNEKKLIQHEAGFYSKSSIQALAKRDSFDAVQQAKEAYLKETDFTIGFEINFEELEAYFEAKSATSEEDEPDLAPRSETAENNDPAPATPASETAKCMLL